MRLRRMGLWVIRRSMTFCLRAERTFKLGSEAENKSHEIKHSSVFITNWQQYTHATSIVPSLTFEI